MNSGRLQDPKKIENGLINHPVRAFGTMCAIKGVSPEYLAECLIKAMNSTDNLLNALRNHFNTVCIDLDLKFP